MSEQIARNLGAFADALGRHLQLSLRGMELPTSHLVAIVQIAMIKVLKEEMGPVALVTKLREIADGIERDTWIN